MRRRGGSLPPPSRERARIGGPQSACPPSSSARRISGWWDSRTRSWHWWSNVGYRKKRSWSRLKCLPGSRMPPLRSVTSCSPSASARTVTAHSLKAIGIGELVSSKEREEGAVLECPVRKPLTVGSSDREPADPRGGTVTYYAQSPKIAKYGCKSHSYSA